MSVDFLRFFVFAFPAYKTQNVCVYSPNPTEMLENAVHIHFAKIHNFIQKMIVFHTKYFKIIEHSPAPFSHFHKIQIEALKNSHIHQKIK